VSPQYSVKVVDSPKIETECNSMAQQGWVLATAYSSARVTCCNQAVETSVLIFKK
jgi:hypothetical protein